MMTRELNSYLVTMENGQQYRFQAESIDDAGEQADNTDPWQPIISIVLENCKRCKFGKPEVSGYCSDCIDEYHLIGW
jgi:hypothetical protein